MPKRTTGTRDDRRPSPPCVGGATACSLASPETAVLNASGRLDTVGGSMFPDELGVVTVTTIVLDSIQDNLDQGRADLFEDLDGPGQLPGEGLFRFHDQDRRVR